MPESVSNMSFLSRISSTSSSKTYKCTVQLLDDSETINCEFKKSDVGQFLLDYVCDYMQIVEKDYFGLRFMDLNKHRYWLDVNKPILRQLHSLSPIVLCLRVKYYPSRPDTLREEITRYQLFLQIRRDMLHGRLYCPAVDAAFLGACIVQSEVGDYDEAELPASYVSEYKLFLKQTSKLEDRVADVHKTLKGLNPAESELKFLTRAATLDTYGFDPYTVKDLRTSKSVYVGVTYQGILVYHTNKKEHHMGWDQVQKVDYVGKEYRVLPQADYLNQHSAAAAETLNKESKSNSSPKPQSSPGEKSSWLKFACPSATFAKHLWKYTLSQQAFFTSNKADSVKPVNSKARIPVFTRGSKFRYSGRVLQEIQEDKVDDRPAVSFVRHHIERQPGREERSYPWMTKYATLPKSHSSKPSPAVEVEPKKPTAVPNSDQPDGTADNSGRAAEAPESRTIDRMEYPSEQDQRCSPVHDFVPNHTHLPSPSKEEPPERQQQQANATASQVAADNSMLLNSSFNESSLSYAKPLANSTPLKQPPPATAALLKTKQPTPVAAAKPQSSVDESSINDSSSGGGGFCRALLLFCLMLIFCIAIFVAVMEVPPERSSTRQVLDTLPGLQQARHLYYEPLRQRLLSALPH